MMNNVLDYIMVKKLVRLNL